MLKKVAIRYSKLSICIFVVFVLAASARVGTAQGGNELPPQQAIDAASEASDLLLSTISAALLQQYAETQPSNVAKASQSIGIVFDDNNHNIRLGGDAAPLSENDLPEDGFENTALANAKVGQSSTSVERVKGKWYYRRSTPLSNSHPSCTLCHTNFGPVNNQWVGALMLRVPIAN